MRLPRALKVLHGRDATRGRQPAGPRRCAFVSSSALVSNGVQGKTRSKTNQPTWTRMVCRPEELTTAQQGGQHGHSGYPTVRPEHACGSSSQRHQRAARRCRLQRRLPAGETRAARSGARQARRLQAQPHHTKGAQRLLTCVLVGACQPARADPHLAGPCGADGQHKAPAPGHCSGGGQQTRAWSAKNQAGITSPHSCITSDSSPAGVRRPASGPSPPRSRPRRSSSKQHHPHRAAPATCC